MFAVLATAGAAYAEEQHDLCAFAGSCRTASAAELDMLRGGFEFGRLRVDIGITREVWVNDKLVGRSQLTLPDLGQLMNGRGTPAFSTTVGGHGGNPSGPLLVNGVPVTNTPVTLPDGGLIVQNGPGNFAPTLSQIGSSAIPTIVQNTLDNQRISTLTLVNAKLNSIELMNTLRLGDVMSRSIAASGR
jgi:hypothetical protein